MENSSMQDFIFIGFDIRIWPWSGEFNVDDTGWDINQDVTNLIEAKYRIEKNEYQLFMPSDNAIMREISDCIMRIETANIAAIKAPGRVVRLLDQRMGYKTSENSIELHDYIMRGFDVCDIDGLFSVLHNSELNRCGGALFPAEEYNSALEFANFANFADRTHAPYVLVEINTLK